jgi:hypothetical protein
MDKLKVCAFNEWTNMYGEGDVILDCATGEFFRKEDVVMSEHGDWFVEDNAVAIDRGLVE